MRDLETTTTVELPVCSEVCKQYKGSAANGGWMNMAFLCVQEKGNSKHNCYAPSGWTLQVPSQPQQVPRGAGEFLRQEPSWVCQPLSRSSIFDVHVPCGACVAFEDLYSPNPPGVPPGDFCCCDRFFFWPVRDLWRHRAVTQREASNRA